MFDVSFLSGIDLFKHLPDSCLEALVKAATYWIAVLGILFFRPEQTCRVCRSVFRARRTPL